MKMVKRIFITIGVILLFCYLLIAGMLYRTGSAPAKYKDIEVVISDSTEQNFVTEADIRQQLRAAKVKIVGQPIDSVNTLEIANILEKNKLIRKAHCYHTPDSLLRIDIDQRFPIIRVKSSSHGDFYVDREGEVMPVQNIVPMQIPLATGFVSTEKASTDLYAIAQFLKDDKFWRQEITQIYVNPNGDIELIPRVGSHTILIGNADRCEEKLDNVRKFYDKVLSKKGWNYYKVINAKFENQIVGEK